MADTSVQGRVGKWVAEVCLRDRMGEPFLRQTVKLSSGGTHLFAAVSISKRRVGTITTSASQTSGGKLAVGKVMKIRADLYFLLLVDATDKFVAFTDRGMFDHFCSEQEKGLIPESIELVLVTDLPLHLAAQLADAQSLASDEVSPS